MGGVAVLGDNAIFECAVNGTAIWSSWSIKCIVIVESIRWAVVKVGALIAYNLNGNLRSMMG